MAKTEDLIAQIPDERLKKAVAAEVRELKKNTKFGLVFVRSFGTPLYPDLVPMDRIEPGGPDKTCHMFINADNFHALQPLFYERRRKAERKKA